LRIADSKTLDEEALRNVRMELDDDVLLESIRAGCPNWGAIYAKYREMMIRAASRVIGMGDKVERSYAGESAPDAAQRAFQKVMRSGIPADVTNLRAYLARAAVNESHDIRRQTIRRHHDAIDEHEEPRHERLGSRHEESIVAQEDVEAVIEQQILEEGIRANLPILTDHQRAALIGRVFEQRPAKDVAAEIGVEPQRISQLVRSAARRLAHELGMLEDESDVG